MQALIVEVIVGAIFLVFGYLLSVKGMITLLHGYHYVNVKEEDKKGYTKCMGAGMYVLGISIILNGILNVVRGETENPTLAIIGAIVALIIMVYAQYRYNGSIFSLKKK